MEYGKDKECSPEMVDVFDERLRPAGRMTREEAHGAFSDDRTWHVTVSCFLVRTNRQGIHEVLLQRRSENRTIYSGLWCATASGHLSAGEGVLDGLREVREEVGVRLRPSSAKFFGARRSVDKGPGFVDREIVHRFLAIVPLETGFVLEEDGVDDLVAVAVDDAFCLATEQATGYSVVTGERIDICPEDVAPFIHEDLKDMTVALRSLSLLRGNDDE